MQDEIRQRLIALESHDLVISLFNRIHQRTLSAGRASEIRAAARQARDYFAQAETASITVRPLLTFYGVASLARSLALLMRKFEGEASLTKGHGLETMNWSAVLMSDVRASIAAIGDLRIRTCGGLFSDLVAATQNRLCVHIRSQAVDWRMQYDVPSAGQELAIGDLLSRLPDLRSDLIRAGLDGRFVTIETLTGSQEGGFSLTLQGSDSSPVIDAYEQLGFTKSVDERITILTADTALFGAVEPQFLHSYVQKTFGTIPCLYLIEPMITGARYSQIAVTYLMSYCLGMLARYFPTHWIAMIDGSKGDRLWPTLHRAQHYIETAFPELVIELIDDVVAHPFQA